MKRNAPPALQHADKPALRRVLYRAASILRIQPRRRPSSATESQFGSVPLAAAGERWPMSCGTPMWPLLQINLADAPYRPAILADVAFIRVYIDPEIGDAGGQNGDGWCLRASGSNVKLKPVKPPRLECEITPSSIRWELATHDLPGLQDLPAFLLDSLIDGYEEEFPTIEATKLGGWPTHIQSGPGFAFDHTTDDEPRYALQIASHPDAGWTWGDSGVGHFGRGAGRNKDRWTMYWENC